VRSRDHGFVVGQMPAGPANAITDVAGVRVGHANHHPDHTGVTAVWPHGGDPWTDWYF
jgi:D-aminopeptidase